MKMTFSFHILNTVFVLMVINMVQYSILQYHSNSYCTSDTILHLTWLPFVPFDYIKSIRKEPVPSSVPSFQLHWLHLCLEGHNQGKNLPLCEKCTMNNLLSVIFTGQIYKKRGDLWKYHSWVSGKDEQLLRPCPLPLEPTYRKTEKWFLQVLWDNSLEIGVLNVQ